MKTYVKIWFLLGWGYLHAEWITSVTDKTIYERDRPMIAPFVDKHSTIDALYHTLDTLFYQADPVNDALKNIENFSNTFIENYLKTVYKLRRNVCITPVHNVPVDAVIHGIGEGAMRVRIMALRASIERGWRFRRVHILTYSDHEEKVIRKIIDEVFENGLKPNIFFTLTHQRPYNFERGCELLVRRRAIAAHFLIIESSSLFASKMEGRARKALKGHAICLGSNMFPITSWEREAKIHGFFEKYANKGTAMRQWFACHMQFLSRKVHYEMLQGKDLDEEEAIAIQFLKSYVPFSRDYTEHYVFKKLALVSLERGLCTARHDPDAYVQCVRAFGIYHYLRHVPSKQPLFWMLPHLIYGMHQQGIDQSALRFMMSMTSKHRAYIQAMRHDIRALIKKLDVFTAHPDAYIKNIFEGVTRDRDKIMARIAKCAQKVLGDAPCAYTVMAYGSAGRSEATPFSDIEFGVLYETDGPKAQHYFKMLSHLMVLAILDLSETVLFQLDIKALYGSTSSMAQWFLDEHTLRGMGLDTLHPKRSKLPIFTKESHGFLGTPALLVAYAASAPERTHLKHANLSERYVCGSRALFNTYLVCKRENHALFKSVALEDAHMVLHHYTHVKYRDWDQKVDFKNTFYRPFTVMLEDLGDIFNLHAKNSFDRIKEMKKRGLICTKEAHILARYFSQVCTIRLSLQMQRDGQYEGIEAPTPFLKKLFALKKETHSIFQKVIDTVPKA